MHEMYGRSRQRGQGLHGSSPAHDANASINQRPVKPTVTGSSPALPPSFPAVFRVNALSGLQEKSIPNDQ